MWKSVPGGTHGWHVRQDLVLVQMVTYVGAYGGFCYLADYGYEGRRTVVGGVIMCSFLEDGRHPRVLPGTRKYTSFERLVEEGGNGRAEVVCEFLQDFGWHLVRSCCFPRVHVPQDSRFKHFQGYCGPWNMSVSVVLPLVKTELNWSFTSLAYRYGSVRRYALDFSGEMPWDLNTCS